MKILFSFLFIAVLTLKVNSQDFYYYKGQRIDLQPRTDKIVIMVNNENYSPEFVKNNLRNIIGPSDELKKISSCVYLLNYNSSRTISEIESDVNSISSRREFVKLSAKTYYGTSKKVTQIPADRFIVKLKDRNDREKLNLFSSLNNCSVMGSDKSEKVFFMTSLSGSEKNALELSNIFYTSGLFEFAEPDFIYPDNCILLSVPNDPKFPNQWALKNSGQTIATGSPFIAYGDASNVNGIPGSDMNVEAAWDYTTGSGNIKIGVIDSGLDSLHPDFQMAGHLMPGYDAYNDINSSAVDVANHGTSTAGLIGAVRNNSLGIAGVAADCQLMSLCIFDINGNTSNSVIARAFDTAAARGIDVLSNSWGGMTPATYITNAIDNSATNGRNGLGCIIVFASGNDGNNPPLYPSVLSNVISVGASTPHDQAKAPGTGNQFYWGSNYGENEYGDLDLVAPTNCYTLIAGGGYDQNFWGTSASCPNAAGVAALVLSVNPAQSRNEVYGSILRGCDKIDNVPYNADKQFGKWSQYYGYGRINALNSVRLSAGYDITPPSINHLNVSSTSSTYPVIIEAEITDQDGSSVPSEGTNVPVLFYKIKKGTAAWSNFDSLKAFSVTGNIFKFRMPSCGWETEVKYYIRARDNSNNESTFPKHAPNPFWLCYYAVGNITCESKKVNPFSGADYGATLSSSVTFGSFKILDTKVIIHMRHTYLDDEVIQIYSPVADANNNRKCLFSSNGADGDNIYDAVVYDSAVNYWKESSPPFLNGKFKPEYNMRGLNGNSAAGSWRIIHFDRGVTDYAFFDSVKIILSRTTGAYSSAIRLNSESDSIVNFDSTAFPASAERNFYLKNSGTSNLNIYGKYFSGITGAMYSIVNTPPSVILPNDSALFKIRLNTVTEAVYGSEPDSYENAVLNIQTNDPSKPVFKVSLQANQILQSGLRQLNLNVLVEGLYNPESGLSTQDSVLVYLANAEPPYQRIDSSTAVIDSAGTGKFIFSNAENETNYYIVVQYRNGISTWSSSGRKFVSSMMSYNFTDSVSRAYGNNLVLKGDKYCIYSGDVDKDGLIDSHDMSMIENFMTLSKNGYLSEDLNNDNVVDASDLGIVENNSTVSAHTISP